MMWCKVYESKKLYSYCWYCRPPQGGELRESLAHLVKLLRAFRSPLRSEFKIRHRLLRVDKTLITGIYVIDLPPPLKLLVLCQTLNPILSSSSSSLDTYLSIICLWYLDCFSSKTLLMYFWLHIPGQQKITVFENSFPTH